MEVYRTEDNTVAKYVHDDGSETAIKSVPTCVDGDFVLGDQAPNKYAIFISSSVGCPIKCKFCYLTSKKCSYHKLEIQDILKNVIDAIDEETKHNPELKNKYVKISWMGMGEAFLNIPLVSVATIELVDYIISKGYALGLDGVDIGTTMPVISDLNLSNLDKLKTSLIGYKRNPANENDRSVVRVFYSLHSPNQEIRNSLIPSSELVINAMDYLERINALGIDVIMHQIFLKDINDNQLDNIIGLCNLHKDFELRVLRFNKCPNTKYDETDNFKEIIERLKTTVPKLKFQVSVGSEILSACGQFIISKIIEEHND